MIILAITILTVLFLLFFLLPRFEQIFGTMSLELPWITQWLLSCSLFLRQNFLIFVVLILVIFFLSKFYRRNRKIALLWEKGMLRLPVLGDTLLRLSLIRNLQLLGLLMRNGVPLYDALTLTSHGCRSFLEQKVYRSLKKGLVQGRSLSESLSKFHFLHLDYTQILAAHEDSSKLADGIVLIRAQLEEEIESLTERFFAALEPMIILSVGMVVAIILIAVYLPIFELSTQGGF